MSKFEPNALWAKTGPDRQYLPVRHHLYDVAAVARVILDNLPRATLDWLARELQLPREFVLGFFVFLCGAHDIGKATPHFQIKSAEQAERLISLGVRLDPTRHIAASEKHGEASVILIDEHMKSRFGPVWRPYSEAIGAHHGSLPKLYGRPSAKQRRLGTLPEMPDAELWSHSQRELLLELQCRCIHEPIPTATREPPSPILGFIAGLCTVADWIGSDQTDFPIAEESDDERWDRSSERARHSLGKKGLGPRRAHDSRNIETLFAEIPKFRLNGLQQQTHEAARESDGLILLEALTGEGKTEAAMMAAEIWREKFQQSGAYFALPTMATSNQMFTRVNAYLSGLKADVETHLLHGRSMFSNEYEDLKLSRIWDSDNEAEASDGRPVASEWIAGPKRGLLSQFGVGTIDQALLSVLRAKHGFVRLFGLARKTVIIDEVHAYDVYMSELLENLLTWLKALDCTVVLLSATLPANKRARLIQAFAQKELPDVTAAYPRIAWTRGETLACKHSPSARRLKVGLEWIPADAVAVQAIECARPGNCVAVICNTVDEAQDLFLSIRAAAPDSLRVDCFHARFPFRRRQEVEGDCLSAYGKDAEERPPGSILVATQVIEQSLDLDFDAIITFLAPIDLLIQRAGRLQRHTRRRLLPPILKIVRPEMSEPGAPSFGPSAWIYDLPTLMRTYCHLSRRTEWALPQDSDELIESVYGDGQIDLPEEWQQAAAKAENRKRMKESSSLQHATTAGIRKPDSENFMESYDFVSDEDDPGAWLLAATRESEPTVLAVCLHEVGGKLAFDPDGKELVPNGKPNPETVRKLAANGVPLSGYGKVNLAKSFPNPKSWAGCPVIKYARKLTFVNGVARTPEREGSFTLDDQIGLRMTANE